MVDQAQRDEACEELQAAIDSTRLKVEKVEAGKGEGVEGDVENLKGIVADMEERVCFPGFHFDPLFPFFPPFLYSMFCFLNPTTVLSPTSPPSPCKPFYLRRRKKRKKKEENKLTARQLKDLRGPPIDLNETLFGSSGLLGAAGGAAKSSIQDAKKNATDLSSLVRKKARDDGSSKGGDGNGKRKAEEQGGEEGSESPKKAKVEDA